MSRRALRKIDPGLDLSGHLRTLDQMPTPWQAEALFANAAPLEVEIGSGKGLFLSTAAAAHPEHNFLGIEVARKYAESAAARLARVQATNAVIVAGDGLRLFHECLPSDSVAAVHVYFPDPWWKKRHRKRRVMNPAFIADIERVLVPGGALHFWTDVQEYFETTLELMRELSPLVGPLPVAEQSPQHDLDYRTHFERRMRLSGLPVFRSEFRKAESSVPVQSTAPPIPPSHHAAD
jgi:tRNA (guanine-N7-)-methyltransferase